MKQIYYCLGIALAACLSSCTDDSLDNGKTVVNPVQTGDEILFSSKLSGDATDSRTVYGDRTTTGVPVYWKAEGDSIAIFCPQSSQPASHLVNYRVFPELDENGEPTETAATVTKFEAEEAGLQWGSSDVHEFYAFYPAHAVKETIDAGEAGQGQGLVRAHIPVEQDVTSWREGTMTIDGKEVPTYFGLPNMDLAYMYAYNSVNKNEISENTPVNLQFHNLLTVLDITIPGPEQEGESVTVTAINVDAVNGANLALTGDFYCYMTNKSGHEPGDCEPVSDPTVVNNRIAISTYNPATKKFITLKHGEQINVKAYIIPHTDEAIGTRQLQVSVVPLNGVAKRKLLQTADIVPSKINRVRLPYLNPGADETNYWMSNLDPNVYFTELSIPGSHQSVGTDSEWHNVLWVYEPYQSKSLAEQFNDGIRAFHFQTTYNRNIRVFACGRTYDELYTYLNQLNKILNDMPADKKDFVVVNIGFKSNGSADDENEWYNELASELNSNSDYAISSIYKAGIDANTTISQLARKIVLRIDRQGTTEVPGLISAQPSTKDAPAEKDMYWGSTNNGRVLTMYAQDATSIDVNGNDHGELPDMATKLDYMKTIFSESVNKYKSNDAHDYLYYMNVGGFYCQRNSGDSEGGDVIQYTEEITPQILDYIQMRGQDAALGLVMMNFADKQADSGAKYGCDALIQTIINNNFTFALRKKASTSTTTYNTTYSRGGNAIGWDE
jgi:hypothetical protein